VSLIDNPVLYWAVAVVVVLAATAIGAQRACLDPWTMYLAGMAGLGGALLGGWLYGVLAAQSLDAEGTARGAIGAFIGAAAFGWLVLKLRGGDFLQYADAAVPGIALGYAVYRIGCFVNGCCFGIPTDLAWGVTFEPGSEAFATQVAAGWIDSKAAHSLAAHPTQLYHAAAGALSFLALTRLGDARPGTRLAFALLAYAVSRFVIEFYRGDALPVWRMLDLNQMFCIAMIAIGALLWMLRPQNGVGALRERAA
jgi:phosphatidylglycerol:prolipoprotein diacylglycerol transferase